jgi:hypothetical protein
LDSALVWLHRLDSFDVTRNISDIFAFLLLVGRDYLVYSRLRECPKPTDEVRSVGRRRLTSRFDEIPNAERPSLRDPPSAPVKAALKICSFCGTYAILEILQN